MSRASKYDLMFKGTVLEYSATLFRDRPIFVSFLKVSSAEFVFKRIREDMKRLFTID